MTIENSFYGQGFLMKPLPVKKIPYFVLLFPLHAVYCKKSLYQESL